jgi:hypothetical protein
MKKSISKLEKRFGKLEQTKFDIGDGEIAINLRCKILGNIADVYPGGRIEMR